MSSSLASITEALIGQNMNAHPDCLGIYIGIDEMYVAQTTKKTAEPCWNLWCACRLIP